MKSVRWLFLLLLCGCVNHAPNETSVKPEVWSQVKPLSRGETIRISTTFQGERGVFTSTIDSQGNISIPAFGIIHVEGMTPVEAGRKLETEYKTLPPMYRHVLFDVSRF